MLAFSLSLTHARMCAHPITHTRTLTNFAPPSLSLSLTHARTRKVSPSIRLTDSFQHLDFYWNTFSFKNYFRETIHF